MNCLISLLHELYRYVFFIYGVVAYAILGISTQVHRVEKQC